MKKLSPITTLLACSLCFIHIKATNTEPKPQAPIPQDIKEEIKRFLNDSHIDSSNIQVGQKVLCKEKLYTINQLKMEANPQYKTLLLLLNKPNTIMGIETSHTNVIINAKNEFNPTTHETTGATITAHEETIPAIKTMSLYCVGFYFLFKTSQCIAQLVFN